MRTYQHSSMYTAECVRCQRLRRHGLLDEVRHRMSVVLICCPNSVRSTRPCSGPETLMKTQRTVVLVAAATGQPFGRAEAFRGSAVDLRTLGHEGLASGCSAGRLGFDTAIFTRHRRRSRSTAHGCWWAVGLAPYQDMAELDGLLSPCRGRSAASNLCQN